MATQTAAYPWPAEKAERQPGIALCDAITEQYQTLSVDFICSTLGMRPPQLTLCSSGGQGRSTQAGIDYIIAMNLQDTNSSWRHRETRSSSGLSYRFASPAYCHSGIRRLHSILRQILFHHFLEDSLSPEAKYHRWRVSWPEYSCSL